MSFIQSVQKMLSIEFNASQMNSIPGSPEYRFKYKGLLFSVNADSGNWKVIETGRADKGIVSLRSYLHSI